MLAILMIILTIVLLVFIVLTRHILSSQILLNIFKLNLYNDNSYLWLIIDVIPLCNSVVMIEIHVLSYSNSLFLRKKKITIIYDNIIDELFK